MGVGLPKSTSLWYIWALICAKVTGEGAHGRVEQ
jgi:hypothetical protein